MKIVRSPIDVDSPCEVCGYPIFADTDPDEPKPRWIYSHNEAAARFEECLIAGPFCSGHCAKLKLDFLRGTIDARA